MYRFHVALIYTSNNNNNNFIFATTHQQQQQKTVKQALSLNGILFKFSRVIISLFAAQNSICLTLQLCLSPISRLKWHILSEFGCGGVVDTRSKIKFMEIAHTYLLHFCFGSYAFFQFNILISYCLLFVQYSIITGWSTFECTEIWTNSLSQLNDGLFFIRFFLYTTQTRNEREKKHE